METNRREGAAAPSDRHRPQQHGKNGRHLQATTDRRIGAERLLRTTTTATAPRQVKEKRSTRRTSARSIGLGFVRR
jgi:hypothetical protein